MKLPSRMRSGLTLVLASAFLLGACASGSPSDAEDTDASSDAAEQSESNDAADEGAPDGFPVTIENCGIPVTFDAPPERILLLETAPVMSLYGIGVLDRVIASAGVFDPEYYPAEVNEMLDQIPNLTDQIDSSGHLEISQEVVFEAEPDLVLGLPSGVSRDSLADAGINALIQEIYCPNVTQPATWQTLFTEIDRYGQVFDRTAQADELVETLGAQIQTIEELSVDRSASTAAVLYASTGGGPLYAYGFSSMAQPQVESLGLENVFGDVKSRVFEFQAEALATANPDVIIILYQGGDGTEATESVTTLPGVDSTTAVVEGNVITQLFNFTEPTSPLVVTGLDRLSSQIP